MKTLLDIIDITNEPNIIDEIMKRFRIIDPSGRTPNTKYDTIQEVVDDLTSSKRDCPQQTYYVECVVDDIIIYADDLIEAWNEGERPKDLQFF